MLNQSFIEVGRPAEQFQQAFLQAAQGRQERADATAEDFTRASSPSPEWKKFLSFQKKPDDNQYIDTISGFNYFSFRKDYNLQSALMNSEDNAVSLTS